MATRRASKVKRALEAKGMECTETHHHVFRKRLDGVTMMVTRVSHGMTEIDDKLGRLMGNQLYLKLGEFWNLVDCPLTEPEWNALVAERCTEGRNPFLGH
jgi:hypothetical protein